VTANAAVDAAACDGTTRAAELEARFEADAIPYMRPMFPAAYRLTRDRHEAEDLIQETFARAYIKFHQFEPGTNLRAWLYCIMFRTFYSTCRKRSRKPAEVPAADLHLAACDQAAAGQAGLVPPSRSAEAEALDVLGDSPVMRALAALPPQFKTVLYLSDIQGLQQSDIADMMGTPVGTVMSRLHRGRAMLRARLRPSEKTAPAGPAAQTRAALPAATVPAATVPAATVPAATVPAATVPADTVPLDRQTAALAPLPDDLQIAA
jgi:RNA polymerase sigma-70 factor, ECF subfamily